MASTIRSAGGLARGAGSQLGGFQKFLLRGNVVDLAVGVVIGAAFTTVVQALVKDVINPLIAVLFGKPDASGLVWTVNGVTFNIGDLINALITFLITAFVVYYFVVMPVNRLMDLYKPAAEPAPT